MAEHLDLVELAEAAEDLLPPERAAAITAHLNSCDLCRAQAAELDAVTARLAAEPPVTMPDHVAARLDAALSSATPPAPLRLVSPLPRDLDHRPTLGDFPARPPRRRRLASLLVAAAMASAVGFGGYVLSARAGLNEPPTVAALASTQDLGTAAQALRQAADLDPHRFSQAWQCARAATEGRITGLAATTVDGAPALLVYTRRDGQTQVTVVTGCNRGNPTAGPSAQLSRR